MPGDITGPDIGPVVLVGGMKGVLVGPAAGSSASWPSQPRRPQRMHPMMRIIQGRTPYDRALRRCLIMGLLSVRRWNEGSYCYRSLRPAEEAGLFFYGVPSVPLAPNAALQARRGAVQRHA